MPQVRLRKDKLRQIRQREGRYLLRSNLGSENPAQLWQLYVLLTQIEEAFKNLKGDLAIQMLDVHFPTTDGRWLIFSRYTSPNKVQKLLIGQLGLELPAQSPPRISSRRSLEPLSSQSRL
ncbi:MAG: hypothetical protein JO151_19585 [Verrucomicrobia bacterium]|nr:hypothetical protein [Verrucomicrobiota bacterium]